MSKNKVETQLIFKWANLSGYSFMFPAGSKAFIQKVIIDTESGDGTYHGLVFRDKQVTEVQFDMCSLKLKGFDDRSGDIAVEIPFGVAA